MEDTIATALITGGATLAGAFVGAIPQFLSSYSTKQRLYSSMRAGVLEGFWKGGGTDVYVETHEPELPFTLEMIVRLKGKRIDATATLSPIADPHHKISLIALGGFYNNDLIQLTYRSKDPARKQMGVIVLCLSDPGTQLRGHYAGYSPVRRSFIAGHVELNKIPPQTLA